jgi:Rne/Rng family ribonuclease
MKQIIVNSENLQTRIAFVVDGRLEEYYIEVKGHRQIVGSIYKGRIRNLEASLQAAFVDIGLEKNAFLHYWDMIPATKDLLEEEDEDKAGGTGEAGDDRDEDDDDGNGDDDRRRGRRRGRGRRDGGKRHHQDARPYPPPEQQIGRAHV